MTGQMNTAEAEKMLVECGECGGEMQLRSGKYGLFWGCKRWPKCSGIHGAHQNSGKPLGIPADKATKRLRIEAHEAFDKLWAGRSKERRAAYAWLAGKLGIDVKLCHMGSFDAEQCKKVIEVCKARSTDVAS